MRKRPAKSVIGVRIGEVVTVIKLRGKTTH